MSAVFLGSAVIDRRYSFLDFAVSATDRGRAMQIQFHTVDVALMGDDFGMNLEHNCPTDFVSSIDRFFFALCHLCFDNWDSISGENLL